MQLLIPVYLEVYPAANGRSSYSARPLFAGAPERRANSVPRVLEQLRSAVGEHLRTLAEDADQAALSEWLSQPEDYSGQTLSLRGEGGSGPLRQFYLVSYRALGRQLVFVPRWPQRHFELPPGEALSTQATRVLGRWLKAAQKQPELPELDELALPEGCSVRLSLIELDFEPPSPRKRSSGPTLAGLGGTPRKLDGAAELRKVGRRLNDLYPQQLDRALGREPEVAELGRRLERRDKPAVLLLGARKVGKSCILQEWLYRHLQDAAARSAKPRELWQLAPQRLISGMSYLGEWEQRVLAICTYAERHDTVLVLDDLPGLFLAGISSGSDLTVGDLLLPWLEQRRLVVLAEIIPEAWGKLRERHRRFAEQFQPLPVQPPDTAQNWQILAALQRQLEQRHGVRFDLDVVPTAYALCARFASDQAFPGKVAEFLKRIASRLEPGARIERAQVLAEFARSSGIDLSLLDTRQPLPRAQISASLGERLRGQEPAIAAISGALTRFKAGLNDPKRPLGVFLLIGPTGVGKTQCAKAVAHFLTGSEHNLLRFDLNEYSDSGDAARLIGTLQQPEGLLTAAIRRQPCSVVLFDEIEKAAPELYDLLLGLLDEGRLSDALGRVADFTSAVILMTSNLGAREAQTQMGFQPQSAGAPVYREAARRFFRPEFFNRLDEVIAFAPFARVELERITQTLITAVLERTGMRARQCLLEIDPQALEALLDSAHDPQLGARALKRGVERALAQPLARLLAAQTGRLPAILRLSVKQGQLQLASLPLDLAVPNSPEMFPEAWDSEGIEQALAEAERQLESSQALIAQDAPGNAIALGSVDLATRHYFACREQQRVVAMRIENLRVALQPRPGRGPRPLPQARALGLLQRDSGADPHDFARWAQSLWHPAQESPLAELARELRWLAWLSAAPASAPVLLRGSALGHAPGPLLSQWRDGMLQLATHLPGLELTVRTQDATSIVLECAGSGTLALLAQERGRWLALGNGGQLSVLSIVGAADTEALPALRVQVLSDGRTLKDLRSGLEIEVSAKAATRGAWWLAALGDPSP